MCSFCLLTSMKGNCSLLYLHLNDTSSLNSLILKKKKKSRRLIVTAFVYYIRGKWSAATDAMNSLAYKIRYCIVLFGVSMGRVHKGYMIWYVLICVEYTRKNLKQCLKVVESKKAVLDPSVVIHCSNITYSNKNMLA